MQYRRPHPWKMPVAEAKALQLKLVQQLRLGGAPEPVRTIAGVDMAIAGNVGYAAIVVLSYPELEVVEEAVASARIPFPYVPGLLSFREIPVLLHAFDRLRTVPDLILVDGQGRLHPRRLGLACHLGLILERPTIGCAKSLLCGQHRPPGVRKGSRTPVTDGEEVLGLALRTRRATRPIYVSSGHLIGLDEAAAHVLAVCPRYRVPEPTRRAHNLAARHKQACLT